MNWPNLTSDEFVDLIFAVTQSILALIVTVGGGLLVVSAEIDPVIITGLIGVVLGYYFGRQSGGNAAYKGLYHKFVNGRG